MTRIMGDKKVLVVRYDSCALQTNANGKSDKSRAILGQLIHNFIG
jgi:hypothetical protein